MRRRAARRTTTVVRLVPYSAPVPLTDGSLALKPAHPPPPARHLSAVPAAPGTPDADLRPAAEVMIRLVGEVLAGIRAGHQLDRLATPEVRAGIAQGSPRPVRGPVLPPRILTSWIQRPAAAVAEVGAVVGFAGQVHALALRLERHHDRWRCAALETTLCAAS